MPVSKKRAKKVKQENANEEIITQALKKRYFELAAKENYPHTPEITQELDVLEKALKS